VSIAPGGQTGALPVTNLDRLGLAGVALVLSAPFLVWHHYYPISSFYSEWTALLCGLIVASSLLAVKRGELLRLPWLSVGFLGLVLVLGVQIVLGRVTHPERNYIAILNAAWAALLIASVANLRSRFSDDFVAFVAQGTLAVAGFLVVVTGFLQYFQLDFLNLHLVEHEEASKYMIGLIGQGNYFANFVACALVSLAYLAAQRRVNLLIAAMIAVPMIIALTLSGSRSALLFTALMPACAFLCYRSNRDGSSFRLLMVCLAAFGLLVLVQISITASGLISIDRQTTISGAARLVESLSSGGSEGELIRGRLAYYAWLQFLSAPLVGVGFGQYAWNIFELSALPELSMGPGIDRHAHNFILQLLAETGILGAACVVVPLAAWFIRFPYKRISMSQSWVLAIALIQLEQAMVEFPHWYAHLLGLFAVALGLGATGGLTLPVNSLRKAVMVVAVATGFVAAASAFKDYRQLETWYLDVEAGERSGKGLSVAQLERLRAMHDASLFAPLMELLAAELLLVNDEDIDAKLDLLDRAMRVYPTPGAAKRQVVLLAIAGRSEEAWRVLRSMSVVYRSRMPGILADLDAYERLHPGSLRGLLERARAELGRQP
jgi:O-antigen ligase